MSVVSTPPAQGGKHKPAGDAATTWFEHFQYVFRHPAARICVAVFITGLNFLIFAEDPVADSRAEAEIPVVGNAVGMVVTHWPQRAWLYPLRLACTALALAAGMWVGYRLLHHRLLRDGLKLNAFRGYNGTWMAMFLTSVVSLFIGSFAYNGVLSALGQESSHVDATLNTDNATFMSIAATGTWLGDSVTAAMVIDMILQDASQYPDWGVAARRWWAVGVRRVVTFWVVMLSCTALVVTIIFTRAVKWSDHSMDAGSDELSRAWLAGIITLLDLVILMQDWEFPNFSSHLDIKLPGLDVTEIKFQLKFMERISLDWFKNIHVNAKWFQYGIIFLVMLLDLNMLKNQILYVPQDYGQYAGPGGHIYSVHDRAVLELAKTDPSILSFAVRGGEASGDNFMFSQYQNYSMGVKLTALLPVVVGVVMFVYLVKRDNMGIVWEDDGHHKAGVSQPRKNTDTVTRIDEGRAGEDVEAGGMGVVEQEDKEEDDRADLESHIEP